MNLLSILCKSKTEQIKSLEEQNKALEREIAKLSKDLLTALAGEDKEIELNNKYPKIIKFYPRKETDGTYNIDVRNFFTPFDENIPNMRTAMSQTDDNIALEALKWVIRNISYQSDMKSYGFDEYWAYPYQTLKRKQGDCEDMSILLANIMLKSGIPYWKIRISAGTVVEPKTDRKVGHCFVTYYHEEKDRWVLLDPCYYPNTLPIELRPDYKDEKHYLETWFSWNQRFAFGTDRAKRNVK